MRDQKPKIAVLDGYTLHPGDLSWDALSALGDLTVYDYTPTELLEKRAEGANILLVNKALLHRELIFKLPDLKCIVVTATGYNNVDTVAAGERGIVVCNAVGYSTEAVVQHVFALLLELTNAVGAHEQSVRRGDWAAQQHFSYTLKPIVELAGKTMGIYGFGNIGKRVGEVAQAFGMQVIATHKHPERDARPGLRFVSLEALFEQSDVVTLHAPLGPANTGIVNASLLQRMKPGALLINTGRGGLINEPDLRRALEEGHLAGAALDVLSVEPPPAAQPLIGAPNCIVTPHLAWATLEARRRLMDICVSNVAAFLQGRPQHVVNPPTPQ
jgi:glycerate dehydrogenase